MLYSDMEMQGVGFRLEPKAGVASGAEARGFGEPERKCTRNANTLLSTCIARGPLDRRSTMILIHCQFGVGVIVRRR